MELNKRKTFFFLILIGIVTAVIGLYFRLYPLFYFADSDSFEKATILTLSHLKSEAVQEVEKKLPNLSGMDKAKLDAQAKIQLEQIRQQGQIQLANINNETKRDISELQGMIQMLIQKMQPPPALASDVGEDLSQESGEVEKPTDHTEVLQQLLQHMSTPKRKVMSITAPSGAVYQGEIADQ